MQIRNLVLFVILALFSGARITATPVQIHIRTQSQFDNLNTIIHDAVADGVTDVEVVFLKGTYYFKDNHLVLGDIKNPAFKLRLKGDGVVVVPEGRTVETDKVMDEYDYNSSVVSLSRGGIVNTWSETEYADADVEVLDVERKNCRLKYSGSVLLKESDCKSVYIMITAWCRAYYYKVQKIEKGYVYFVADNLAEGINWVKDRNGYNVNNDYIYAKTFPRYRLCNTEPLNIGRVHICEAQTFINDVGGSLKSLSISGFTFLGNKNVGNADNPQNSLLFFDNVVSKGVIIRRCKFIGHNTKILSIRKTNDLTFDDNYVAHNFRWGIYSYNSSNRTTVTNNDFEYNGESMSYDRCVTCCGSDYYIANNKFTNYGYCGISVGMWYGGVMENKPKGIVENNVLVYTDDWMRNVWKHTIMDSGAIYLWTKNKGTIVRYNVIKNYGGAKDNRGIFCDDGAFNIELYGNVITGVTNSYCIDSRRVASVESQSIDIDRSNVNIVIRDNLVDGRIRFEGNEEDNNACVLGNNYYLQVKETKPIVNTVKNVDVSGDNILLDQMGEKNDRVVVTRRSYNNLRKSPEWKLLKKQVRR